MANILPANVPFGPERPTADLSYRLICPDCRKSVPNIIEDFAQGDLICGDCGLVLGHRIIDTRSEWRTFSNSDDAGDDPSRVGASVDQLLGSDRIESTMVGYRDGGSGFAKDLHRAHQRAIGNKSEKALLQAFKEIQALGERINLNKIVIDSGKQLYKTVEEQGVLKSKHTDAVIAACLFFACRQHKVGRTFKEFCGLTGVAKKEIGKCFKALVAHLDAPMQAVENSLDSYVARFASLLRCSSELVIMTTRVAHRAAEIGALTGKSPITLVAACLYFTCNLLKEYKNAREVASIAGCTEGTLKNAYRLLLDVKYNLVDKESKYYKELASLGGGASSSASAAANSTSSTNTNSTKGNDDGVKTAEQEDASE